MRKLKITQGTTKVDCGIDLIGENDELMQIIVFSETENTHNLAHVFAFNQERLEANAQLIADAFNTANKCDMLPSELLELLINVYCSINQYGNISDSQKEILEKLYYNE